MGSGDQQTPGMHRPRKTCAGDICQQNPKPFSSLREEDIEDWMVNYEQLRDFNRWDDTSKLRNAIFCLNDVARV